MQGAKIMADGTKEAPITFTTAVANPGHGTGMWGGLIILGKAPTSKGTNSVEGLPDGDGAYGGSDNADNSGVLRYVRVWHGGSVIGQDNEINGITFAGVGSGTTCENIEVAFNKDDGVEFFGGTVNCKFVSVLYVDDDAIDMDLGYQGKIQFLFIMVKQSGHHAFEIDNSGSNPDATPRTWPKIYHCTVIGPQLHSPGSESTDDYAEGLVRIREGAGGEYANFVVTNVPGPAVYQDTCGTEVRTQTKPFDGADTQSYMWFSKKNILNDPSSPFALQTGCTGLTDSVNADPQLRDVAA